MQPTNQPNPPSPRPSRPWWWWLAGAAIVLVAVVAVAVVVEPRQAARVKNWVVARYEEARGASKGLSGNASQITQIGRQGPLGSHAMIYPGMKDSQKEVLFDDAAQ